LKAAVHYQYGPPEVIQLAEMAKPIPKENEVLIKVYASTVNRTDCGFRSAEYFVSRFFSGLLRPKNPILGSEFAGEVETVGSAVKDFKPGDRVVGFSDSNFGGHAEYVCIEEKAGLTIMPKDWKYAEAAPLLEGSHYALCDLRAAKVEAGQKVMVYGASGAIGSAAVQLLKHFGAEIWAVCGPESVELIKNLGAHHVIDYTKEDFTKTGVQFDLIYDAVGKTSFGACRPLLKNKGIYKSTELGKGGANIFYALVTPWLGGKKVLFPIPFMKREDADFIKNLAESGKFRPLIDRSYTLDQIVEAYEYVESRRKIGNVVIIIRPE